MNLMLEERIARKLHSGWLIVCYMCLLPFGFLFTHDGWYGVGLGRLGHWLMLLAILLGFGASLWVIAKGNWWQKLLALPTLLLFGSFVFLLAGNVINRFS